MEPESPPSRTTILSSLLRGRPRNTSNANTADNHAHELSPPPLSPSPVPLGSRSRRSQALGATPATATQMQPSTSQPQQSSGLTISHMLRRRRSAGNVQQQQSQSQNSNQAQHSGHAPTHAMSQTTQAGLNLASFIGESGQTASNATSHGLQQTPGLSPPLAAAAPSQSGASSSTSYRIRLVPQLDSRRSLRFDPIGRDLRESDPPLRIGRFTDRSGLGLSAINSINSNKLAFRSKVVSRAHAEIWVEAAGKFFIRDTKSSSGTFLNHIRLSSAGAESRPFPLRDGDVLQLGVDYQGGTEDIYKSVKIRVEIGREWQAGVNAFNANAFKNIKALALPTSASATTPSAGRSKNLGIPDCCICLFSVTIRQALFIAPCSHAFHYKCIKPVLEAHQPAFSCPLCRTFADLEEDVEVDEGSWEMGSDVEKLVGDGAVPPSPGGGRAEGGDDRMDVDGAAYPNARMSGDERPAVVLEEPEEEGDEGAGNPTPDGRPSLSPCPEGVLSGDEDSDMAPAPIAAQHQDSSLPPNSIPINNSNTLPVQDNLGTGNNGSSAVWGSPGAESRGGSTGGDSPILVNVIGGPGQGAPIAITAGGGGGVDGDMGMVGDAVGIEGETVGGKRKR